jgi:hypothetical protein
MVMLAARRPVDLAPIEWDGDHGFARDSEPPQPANDPPMLGEPRRMRIRDRYIGARFPGAARGAADLQSPERVVKSARLYFEDGHAERALELLDLAIADNPRAEELWLAQLEILFLARDAARYAERARAFRAEHAKSSHWAEVARLGRSLAPSEALFGAKAGPRRHDHYGPWPHLPNWIQASWDLTGEVLASDFHRLLGSTSLRAA